MRPAVCFLVATLVVAIPQCVLGGTCPVCGMTNPDDAAFCGGCGARLGVAEPAPRPPAQRPPTPGRVEDPAAVLKQADEAYARKRWDAARELYQKLLALDPLNPVAKMKIDECARRADSLSHAEELGTWCAEMSAKRGYHLATARAALDLGDSKASARYALLALACDWQNAEAKVALGRAMEGCLPTVCFNPDSVWIGDPRLDRGPLDTVIRQSRETCAELLYEAADDAARAGKSADSQRLSFIASRLEGAPLGLQREHMALPNEERLEMTYLPGGTFAMGSPPDEVGRRDDETAHDVLITGFWIGSKEVTQSEYRAVLGQKAPTPDKAHLPVTDVSWLEAARFCNRLSAQQGFTPCYNVFDEYVTWHQGADGFRLPTEAEWEYACRAGTTTEYNNGTGEAALRNAAWFAGTSGGIIKPVGRRQPNAWGLSDMHGNAAEWSWDWYGSYQENETPNPTGPNVGFRRVVRGGGCLDKAHECRAAARQKKSDAARFVDVGFRLARGALTGSSMGAGGT